jgi:hypothetical protein
MQKTELHDPTKAFLLGLVFPGVGYAYVGSYVAAAFVWMLSGVLIFFAVWFRDASPFFVLVALAVLSARGARIRADEHNRQLEFDLQHQILRK